MIQIHSARKKRFRMDMAPLIDVVFLLLIFFMLTFAIAGQGLDLTLPQGESANNEVPVEDLTIKILPGGIIHLNGKPILLSLLEDSLRDKIEKRRDKHLIIETDKTVRFSLFTRVLDVSRLAGAKDFTLLR